MDVNTSKRILSIFGILDIIFGVFAIIGAALFLITGGAIGSGVAENPAGETAEAIQGATAIAGIALIFGAILLICGLVFLLRGIYSRKASKDSSKAGTVLVLGVIGVVIQIANIVTSTLAFQDTTNGGGGSLASGLIGIIMSVIVIIAAYSIKKHDNI